MRTHRNILIFLLICFFLAFSGCYEQPATSIPPSPEELFPTTDIVDPVSSVTPVSPVSTSGSMVSEERLPTATARASLERLATATPAPSLAVGKIVPGVIIADEIDFDIFVAESGNSIISFHQIDSIIEIRNEKDWKKLDDYSKFLLEEGEGIVFKFRLVPYTNKPKIFLESVAENGTVFRWGVRPTFFQETYVKRDDIKLHERGLLGSVRVRQGEWYYLLLTVEENAYFRAVIWSPNDPDIQNEIREQLPPEWFARVWRPEIRMKSGQINLNEYIKIVLGAAEE